MFSDLVAELPFILMHPKPDDDEPIISDRSPNRTLNSDKQVKEGCKDNDAKQTKDDVPNLIQLDGYVFVSHSINVKII